MKKIILTLLVVMSFTFTYGQGKWQEKQNDYFVEAAAKEYDLSDDQKVELKETRLEMVKSFMDSNQKSKSGEITKDEMKASNREASKTFNSAFAKLTGKPYKELAPFLKKMREELKNLK
jgi:predicted negative regulator of RcsB-dependent stress response